MAKITFVLEDDQEVEVPLGERTTIGRADDNDVLVEDERISKHHAEVLAQADGDFEVRDLGSVAGTFVNDERVTLRVLRDGDKLAFGPLQGRFSSESEEQAPPPEVGSQQSAAAATFTAPISIKTTKVPVHGQPKVEENPAASHTPAVEKARPGPVKPPEAKPEPGVEKQSPSVPDDSALREKVAQLERDKARLQQEIAEAEETLEDWRMKSTKERNIHENRLSTLRAAEERMLPMQAAAKHAEKTHAEWVAAVQKLSVEHTEKTTALQQAEQEHEQRLAESERLTATASAVQQEIEALTAQQQQENDRLERLRQETAQEEARLQELRASTEQETARLQQEEAARLQELRASTAQETARLQQETAGHEARLAELRNQQAEWEQRGQQARAATEEQMRQTVAAAEKLDHLAQEQQRAEEALQRTQKDLSAHESTMAAAMQRLEAANTSVAEALARLAETEAKHESLALTDQQVADLSDDLVTLAQQRSAAERQLSELHTAIAETEASRAAQASALQNAEAETGAASARLAELAAQESTLRQQIASLTATLNEHQSTLEEVRRHAAAHDDTRRAIEAARTELTELTTQLTPLRDWKEAMDQLYARFAALPQSSPQAQELWREIETGTATLRRHILSTQTRTLPRIMHIEFSRQGVKPGTPMKSERVRSKGGA